MHWSIYLWYTSVFMLRFTCKVRPFYIVQQSRYINDSSFQSLLLPFPQYKTSRKNELGLFFLMLSFLFLTCSHYYSFDLSLPWFLFADFLHWLSLVLPCHLLLLKLANSPQIISVQNRHTQSWSLKQNTDVQCWTLPPPFYTLRWVYQIPVRSPHTATIWAGWGLQLWQSDKYVQTNSLFLIFRKKEI